MPGCPGCVCVSGRGGAIPTLLGLVLAVALLGVLASGRLSTAARFRAPLPPRQQLPRPIPAAAAGGVCVATRIHLKTAGSTADLSKLPGFIGAAAT